MLQLNISCPKGVRNKAYYGLNQLLSIAGLKPTLESTPGVLLNYGNYNPEYDINIPIISEIYEANALKFRNHWLTSSNDNYDMVAASWWLLSRFEECQGPWDNHNRWNHLKGVTFRTRMKPLLEIWSQKLKRIIIFACEAAKSPWVRICTWPKNRPWATTFTHDVDMPKKWRIPTLASRLLGTKIEGAPSTLLQALKEAFLGPDPWWCFKDILSMEKAVSAKSTWFVCPKRMHPKDPFFYPYSFFQRKARDQLMRLYDAGSEVGLHGSYADLEKGLESLISNKKALTNLGLQADGHRSHYLRWRVETSWPLLNQLGFIYDSSLGFTSGYGWRAGCTLPFETWDHNLKQPLKLIELPLALMDRELMRKTEPEQIEAKLSELVSTVRRIGGYLNVLWHVRVYNSTDFPGWGEAYQWLLQTIKQDGAWIATCSEVANWWIARKALQLNISKNKIEIKAPISIKNGVLESWWPNGKLIPSEGVKIELMSNGRYFIYLPDLRAGDSLNMEVV